MSKLSNNKRKIEIPEKENQRILGDFLLLKALEEQNLTGDLEFQTTFGGKPFLASHPHVKFNISHSFDLVVVAISLNKEVGVDIEMIREKPVLDIARRIFHSSEADLLESMPEIERKELFFKFWTLKESFMKTYDLRLRYALRNVSFAQFKDKETGVNSNTNFYSYKIDDVYRLSICQNH